MILYLLVLILLLLDGVESQTANMTKEEWSQIKRNYSGMITPGNVTSRQEYELSLIEGELQDNQTSAFVTEDDEMFQQLENAILGRDCKEKVLEELIPSICGMPFHTEMTYINPTKWCEMEYIIMPYNYMSDCLETVSHWAGCYSPNPITQDYFLSIHSQYFHNCSKKDLQFVDAPYRLVVALTLVPISLIPVLVYLVVCKSGV
ncbi:receptor activity-modifying protein 3 [Spinachia spinachia]